MKEVNLLQTKKGGGKERRDTGKRGQSILTQVRPRATVIGEGEGDTSVVVQVPPIMMLEEVDAIIIVLTGTTTSTTLFLYQIKFCKLNFGAMHDFMFSNIGC